MNLFLRTIPVEEAIRIGCSIANPPGEENIPLAEAVNRVLARDISADIDIPGFNRSVVDGYAVRASDTVGAAETIPSLLTRSGTIRMGTTPTISLAEGECAYIPTGGELPEGTDAVVMIEHTETIDDQVLVKRPVASGENCIRRGEDFTKGTAAITKGRRLSPSDIGVLAAVGCSIVPVCSIPRIGVISTGNELISVDKKPSGSEIRDSNSVMLGAYLRAAGCTPYLYGIVKDEREILREILHLALGENDAVILSGGSSKDERDLCADLIAECGEVLVHGVAIAPGKPTIIGRCMGKPVLGLPGHPASALVVLDRIGRPLLSVMSGEIRRTECTRSAILTQNIPSTRGREDYIRVKLDGKHAIPLFGKSGLLNTLVQSDGILRIPAGSEGIEKGAEVEVIIW